MLFIFFKRLETVKIWGNIKVSRYLGHPTRVISPSLASLTRLTAVRVASKSGWVLPWCLHTQAEARHCLSPESPTRAWGCARHPTIAQPSAIPASQRFITPEYFYSALTTPQLLRPHHPDNPSPLLSASAQYFNSISRPLCLSGAGTTSAPGALRGNALQIALWFAEGIP